jgi:hypothetical protein
MRQVFVLAVALLVVGSYAAFYADRAVGKDFRFLRELTWTERFAPLRR